MSYLGKAITRGFGNEIGRSVARTAINKVAKGADANYIRVDNPIEPSDFKIESNNRVSTVENKFYNAVTVWKNSFSPNSLDSIFTHNNLCTKYNEVVKFIKFKGGKTMNVSELFIETIDMIRPHKYSLLKVIKDKKIKGESIINRRRWLNPLLFLSGFLFIIPWFFINRKKDLKASLKLEAALEDYLNTSLFN